jgi:putative tryptophan/tyrosine transport system substrate-binding protein
VRSRFTPVLLAIGTLAVGPRGGGRGTSPAPAPRVTAILSSDAEPYQQALAGFRRELQAVVPGATIDVVALHGDTVGLAVAAARVEHERPALVLTLGTLATRAIIAQVHSVPIVAGMVLNAAELTPAPNVTGVYLEYPVEVELRWLKRLLPGERRVGVIYHSAENGERAAEAQRLAPGLNLSIHPIRVEGPADLPDALTSLSNRADVLWSVTDPVVYNAETARTVLLFSLRNRIPLVGQSAAWVKAGALYALDRDYTDVGAQCAGLAGRILNGEAPSTVSPVPPRKVRYIVNAHTATELRLSLPDRVDGEPGAVLD